MYEGSENEREKGVSRQFQGRGRAARGAAGREPQVPGTFEVDQEGLSTGYQVLDGKRAEEERELGSDGMDGIGMGEGARRTHKRQACVLTGWDGGRSRE